MFDGLKGKLSAALAAAVKPQASLSVSSFVPPVIVAVPDQDEMQEVYGDVPNIPALFRAPAETKSYAVDAPSREFLLQ